LRIPSQPLQYTTGNPLYSVILPNPPTVQIKLRYRIDVQSAWKFTETALSKTQRTVPIVNSSRQDITHHSSVLHIAGGCRDRHADCMKLRRSQILSLRRTSPDDGRTLEASRWHYL